MQRPGREKDARRKPVTDEKAVQDGVTYKQPIQVSGAEKDITQVLRKGKRFNPKTREIRQPFQKKPAKKRGLSDFPLEFLQHVFPYLPLPSQVCLASTLKVCMSYSTQHLELLSCDSPLCLMKDNKHMLSVKSIMCE